MNSKDLDYRYDINFYHEIVKAMRTQEMEEAEISHHINLSEADQMDDLLSKTLDQLNVGSSINIIRAS